MLNRPLERWNLWEGPAPYASEGVEELVPTLTPYMLASDSDDNNTPAGAVIICPGGGYGGHATHEGEPIARWLNSLGIHAFVLHYRVNPSRHPAPLSDAQQAIRTIRSHAAEWGIHAEAIGILGFSAGGHLSAHASTTFDPGSAADGEEQPRVSSRPDFSILCYPVISSGEYAHRGSFHNLAGKDADEALVRSLSAELLVDAHTPPAFIWHTADDEGVPEENALLYAQALSQYQIPHALHIFQHGRHGLGLAKEDPTVALWTKLCECWLNDNGWT